MKEKHHDLFLAYTGTLSAVYSQLPLILVVGREPNDPNSFRSSIGNYKLEAQYYNGEKKKRTVAFWDQSYGTIGKVAGMSCRSLKAEARRVGASPIVFTDVMPTPAVYAPGSAAPEQAREAADEQSIHLHHQAIFNTREIMDRVSLVVLAGHRHGSFKKRERLMLGHASTSFADHCSQQKHAIEVVQTKSMFGNNQSWNIDAIKANDKALIIVNDIVNQLKAFDKSAALFR